RPTSPCTLFPYTTLFRSCLFEKMIGNIQEVKTRGGSIIALTSSTASTRMQLESMLDAARDFVVAVPAAPELLTSILMAVPLQLRSEEHTSELQSPYDLVC